MGTTQKETDNQGGILLNAAATVCYSKAATHLAILDSSFAAGQNWPYSHTAVRNSILRKREISGVKRGKKEGNMKSRMTSALLVIRLIVETITYAPNIFYVVSARVG